MSSGHISDLDIGLLRALDALLRDGQVTRAAQRLGLTQSALSHALGRLRQIFDDPLFVRTPRGITATPRAAQLAEPLARILGELERLVSPPEAFDPAKLARRFSLVSADYTDMAMLPPLLRQMAKEAPRCDLDVRTIGADLEEALEDGRIDLALGVFPRLSGRIMKQRLFSDRLTSLVRRGHPAARGRLTRERFAALAHIQIAPRGTPGGPVDDALSGHGLQRRVAVRIGSFLSATQLVADSDLVLTAPERLARVLVGALPLQMIKPPLELPEFHIYQVWHERRQQDPAHAWLRGSLAAIAQVI